MKIQQILDNSYKLVNPKKNFVDFLLSIFPKKTITIIGIEGASGSGKTTFTSKLTNQLPKDKSVYISLDDYVHLTKEEMLAKKIKTRYDWHSRNKKKFLSDLAELRQGKSIKKPIQDYIIEKPTQKTETIKPKPLIFIEGNLDITDVCDYTIFLFAPDDILIQRRFERDKQKNTHADKTQLLKSIQTSLKYYHEFLEPFIVKANIVINTHSNAIYKKVKK